MTHNRFAWAVAAIAVFAAGCSSTPDSGKVALTEHQRDSVLAKSALPGAIVVDRALKVSAKASDRASGLGAAVDSLGQ